MAGPIIRKEGQRFSAGQQAAMFYARKRRKARIAAGPANAQVGRPRSYLGLQIAVQVVTQ
jgi:hypothetical protein